MRSWILSASCSAAVLPECAARPEATASESDSEDANPFGGLDESDSSDGDASA